MNPPSINDLLTDADRALIAELDGNVAGALAGIVTSSTFRGHYDRAGNPITFGTWSVLFEKIEAYRIIRQTWTRSGAWISTVWMGLDHAFGVGRPLIFETMIFADGDSLDCDRYATEAEAIAGHEAYVAKYGGPDHDGGAEHG